MAITAAAIDIGTNSVKLTVGRYNGDRLEIVTDTTRITRLGKGVDAGGRLDSAAIDRTLDALHEFIQLAQAGGATRIAVIGTSALRDAANGAEFVDAARVALLPAHGTIEIIAGEREAALIYTAARRDPDLRRLTGGALAVAVTDVGGGSTEVVIGAGEAVQFAGSLQLGAVRLTERAGMVSDPPTDGELIAATAIARELLHAAPASTGGGVVVVGSGGTAANLAAMQWREENPETPLTIDTLHGMTLTRAQITDRIARLAALPLAARRNTPGLEPDRADVIVAGAIIQAEALARLGADSLLVSLRGLRYGLLYELLG